MNIPNDEEIQTSVSGGGAAAGIANELHGEPASEINSADGASEDDVKARFIQEERRSEFNSFQTSKRINKAPNNSNNFQITCPNCSCSIHLAANVHSSDVLGAGNLKVFNTLRSNSEPTAGSSSFGYPAVSYESDDDSNDGNVHKYSRPSKSGLKFVGEAMEAPMSSQSSNQAQAAQAYKELSKSLKIKVEDLKKAADVVQLKPTAEIYKALGNYVKNSYGLKFKLEVNDIYSYSNKNPIKMPSGVGSKHSSLVKKKSHLESAPSAATQDDNYSMLLWYSAPKSALGAILTDGLRTRKGRPLLVFYDRAFKVLEKCGPVKNGLAILCQVSFGKVYKSPHGIGYWSQNKIPSGFDSVKGTGELMPDWSQNYTSSDGIIIPLGETIKNQRFPQFELKFNEYVIQDETAVKIKFIVDLSLSK